MKQLEKRFYKRQEIADVLDLDIEDNKHFKRNLENKLLKWGYSYEYSRQGVSITRQPQTAVERLSEIMIRVYELDVQIDIIDFANFLYLLLVDESFASMPWAERAVFMKDEVGIQVNEVTLKRWASKLIKMNLIHKSWTERSYWVTFYIEGEKQRMMIDDEESRGAMKEYMDFRNKKRNVYLKDGKQLGRTDYKQLNCEAWKFAMKEAWNKYHHCYYSCSYFMLNALGTEAQEIFELLEEIQEENIKESYVKVSTEIVTSLQESFGQQRKMNLNQNLYYYERENRQKELRRKK